MRASCVSPSPRSGAVLDLSVDGGKATPVVLKETQRDPVRGETVHVDLLRVRLDQAIHAVVPIELTGTEDAPGVKEGGVLEQITRELNVEALPTAIPESIVHDVGEMQIGDHIGLADVTIPEGVTLWTTSRRRSSRPCLRPGCRPRWRRKSRPRRSSSARARSRARPRRAPTPRASSGGE